MLRQRGSSIAKSTLKDGSVRWRFRIDLPPDADGRRRQRTITAKTEAEAIRLQARARGELSVGTYVEPSRQTVDDLLDTLFEVKSVKWRAGSLHSATSAAGHVRKALGPIPAQKLTRQHVARLARTLLTEGGRENRGRSPKTVRQSIALLHAALEIGVKDGLVVRNVAAGIELPRPEEPEMHVWNAAELEEFLQFTHDHWLHVGFELSALGLRRGEVLALRWSDVDFERKVIRIRRNRTIFGGQVVEGAPKSSRSARDIPMTPATIEMLKSVRAATLSLSKLRKDAYIVSDEAGEPVNPSRYSYNFDAAVKRSGLPRIKLHGMRHSVITLMLEAGVPLSVVAKFSGHDVLMAARVYSHVGEKATFDAAMLLDRARGK